jgi:hypothetical protein
MDIAGSIANFTPHRGPTTLRGFFALKIPELDLELPSLMVHEKGASKWLAIPGVPQRGKDGSPVLKPNGKPAYKPVLIWSGKTWEDLQARVIEALVARYPEAFDGDRS